MIKNEFKEKKTTAHTHTYTQTKGIVYISFLQNWTIEWVSPLCTAQRGRPTTSPVVQMEQVDFEKESNVIFIIDGQLTLQIYVCFLADTGEPTATGPQH
jgi:hypothetical protein